MITIDNFILQMSAPNKTFEENSGIIEVKPNMSYSIKQLVKSMVNGDGLPNNLIRKATYGSSPNSMNVELVDTHTGLAESKAITERILKNEQLKNSKAVESDQTESVS